MRPRSGFTYVELLCVLTIVALVWLILLPPLTYAKLRADESDCLANLKNISWALRMYAQDHYGHMPPDSAGLHALVPRYLHDYEAFRCPTVVARERLWSGEAQAPGPPAIDYTYRAGLADDDHPAEAVVWDNAARHRDGGNVLYLSSRVAWTDEQGLKSLSASQRAMTGRGAAR